MSKRLTLSIVIPVYNEERYLKACLDSLANQSLKPDEVIVVDNGSTDDTARIAKSYSFVRLLSEPQRGTVWARNKGFNSARSDIIGRIDADTRLSKNWAERTVDFFESRPDVAAASGRFYFYDLPFRSFTQAGFGLLYFKLQKLIAGTDLLWGANMALRRPAWQKVRQNCHSDNDIYEDIDLALNLNRAGRRVARSHQLIAEVSFLRGRRNPWYTIRYVAAWHKTYFRNGLYMRGVIIYLLKLIILIPTFIFYGISYPWSLSKT